MTGDKRIISVALVGAGEVAMVIHLPTLLLCSHMYRVVALVDISQQSLDFCADKFHVPHTYTDLGDMLQARPEVELVFILSASELHASQAIQCLEAGKHVMIEKPMALSLPDVASVEAARQASGKVALVGYMRRYAEGFLRVKEMIRGMPKDEINHVRVRNFTYRGPGGFVAQSGTFPQRFTDFPPGSAEKRAAIVDPLFETALGPDHTPADRSMWMLLNGLSSHDLSAMRELVGKPKRAISAARGAGGFLTILFEHEGFNSVGFDSVNQVDATIEILTKSKRITLRYDTSYIKGLPTTVHVMSRKPNGDLSEEVIRATYEDFYTLEYKALYSAIVNGTEVKTSVLDARNDIEMFHMVMDALKR